MKINGAYYSEALLTQKLLSFMLEIYGEFFKAMFLLTEGAKQSTFWNETPAFISADLSPTSSTDLNPADDKIWGEMQQRV